MTKTAILEHISRNTELTKKQASSVFDELTNPIESHVKKETTGHFTFPGLLKIEVRHKPATKAAHKGINPFTGEETMFKAKPARNVVRIRPLKKLQDIVA
jgi:nucleoid DNA-binding protein